MLHRTDRAYYRSGILKRKKKYGRNIALRVCKAGNTVIE